VQAADLIALSIVSRRQGIDDSPVGQNNKSLYVPETSKKVESPNKTSTPPPPMDHTSQSESSSACAIDEL
jgi:hypothetical protein